MPRLPYGQRIGGNMAGTKYANNGNARTKPRNRLRQEGRPCHLCGQPIDYDLPSGDPWSFELDHVVPLARGGAPWDYANAAASHRICNQRKGKKMPTDGQAFEIRRTRLF